MYIVSFSHSGTYESYRMPAQTKEHAEHMARQFLNAHTHGEVDIFKRVMTVRNNVEVHFKEVE